MKRVFFLLAIVILFSNCTHKIVRSGYEIKKSDYKDCEVVIKKFTPIPDTLAHKIGEIRLGETGFSTACSEAHAIDIIKKEACAIGADLILITEENRPDFWSSCYRCKAEFYLLKSSNRIEVVSSDSSYESDQLKQRVSKDRSRNTGIILGSVIGGLLAVLLLANM